MRILLAWYFWITNRNDEVAQRRLKICSTCNKRKWFVCRECGCPIQAKARLLDETCPHPDGNKWRPKHEHAFVLQYRTGNSIDGKTEVLKCDCGQWAIRPSGASSYTMIE